MSRRFSKLLAALLFLLCSSLSLFAQKTITGRVTDAATGLPMEGVNVTVKGTNSTVGTNAQGDYAIPVPNDNATLIFSFVGYGSIEKDVRGAASLSVTLSNTQKSMDEVVVIGYGSVRRRDLTGAVTTIKPDVITQTPTNNALEALQGRVPGMDITRSSGQPGSGANVVVRGFKNINTDRQKLYDAAAPLVIIDGFQGGDLATLNTNDIESIEVLRDASSTAIYGAQGGNGVILVTTKRGRQGKTTVNYSGYYGINTFMYPSPRLGEDYIQLRREAFRTSGKWASPADDPKIFPNLPGELAAYQAGQYMDLLSLAQHNGHIQSHVVSVTTGSEKTKLYLSSGYYGETGMLQDEGFRRYNVRANVDQTISKILKAGLSTQITFTNQDVRRSPLGNIMQFPALGTPYDSNGAIKRFPLANDTRVNPLVDETSDNVAKENSIRNNTNLGAFAELTPIRGLSIRTNFNATLYNYRRGQYYDKTSLASVASNRSTAYQETDFQRSLNWDNIVTYTRRFGDHDLTATALTSYIRFDEDKLSILGSGQALASQLYYGLGATASGSQTITSPFYRSENMGYAARLNYSYKGKYVLYLSGRYDGASRLSEGHKWAFFPAAGLAWNISDENFMKNIKLVNSLKLRGTYGQSGIYSSVDIYGTQSGLYYSGRMSFGETPAPAYFFNPLVGNPDLTWATTTTTNLGLDFGILNNRITGNVDAFTSKTTDLIFKRALPISTGVQNVYQNIATMESKGIEVVLNTQNVVGKTFRWTSTFTYARTDQHISKLITDQDLIVDERNSLVVGQPVGLFYSFIKDGIWQSNEAAAAAGVRYGSSTGTPFKPGDLKLRDISGPNGKPDGVIDSKYDRVPLGSIVPDWVGGIQNTLNYKNFDLSFYLLFRYGQMLDDEMLGRYNPNGLGNGPAFINYWTPENPTNDFPRPAEGLQLINVAGYQTLNFVDGSFWKLKNLTLGYTLPTRISNKIKTDRIRIYATANNLYTHARSHLVVDYDPERGGSENNPIGRQFVFGLNLGF